MKVHTVVKKQEIWDEEKEVAKSEEKTNKLVLLRFYKWIYVQKEDE